MHKIDELPEEKTIRSTKLNRSLTDLIQSANEPTVSIKKKTLPSTSNTDSPPKPDSDKEDEDDDMETLTIALQSYLIDDEDQHDLKHSASEPVIKTNPKSSITTNDILDDDDDDDWCNQEDVDNLEHRVKLDEEKEKRLREVLGEETLAIIRDALKVKKFFSEDFL